MTEQGSPAESAERIAFERLLLARGVAASRQAATPRPEVVPASFGQERMWLSEWFDPTSSTETTVFVIGLRGPLDVPAVRGAVADLIQRHEVLRTLVAPEGARLVQRILAPPEEALTVVDLARNTGPEAVAAFAREQLSRKPDLAAEPPAAYWLLCRSEHEHHLVVRLHHIAADGWSEGVLNRDLSALYRARVTGDPAGLPELPWQYADFALRQRERLTGPRLERGLAHWRRRLADAPTTAELPFDHEPEEESPLGSGTSYASMPGPVVDGLARVAAAEVASPFMALLAVFAVALWLGSWDREVVIGSPVAGRDEPETEQLAGVFTNTLAIRVGLRPAESFRELLRRVRRDVLDDLAAGDVPFQRVVEALRPARTPGRLPLVQAIFQLDNTAFAEPEFPGLDVAYEQLFAERSALDLTVSAGRRGDDFVAVWKYRSALFDPSTVHRMQDRFLDVMTRVAADPDAPLRNVVPAPTP